MRDILALEQRLPLWVGHWLGQLGILPAAWASFPALRKLLRACPCQLLLQ